MFLPQKCCLLGSAFGCIFLMVLVFFWLRAESAPKPLVSKKPMEFDDFQSWFRRPRDRSSARSVSKTCSKKRLPEDRKSIFFFIFFCFWPPRAADQKTAAKMASEVLPERLQGSPGDPAGAQNRSTSRLRPARGARQVMFGILGGLPGRPGEGPGGPRSLQDPPGRLQGKLVPKVLYSRAFQRWTP